MDVYCEKPHYKKDSFSAIPQGAVFYCCDFPKPLIKISEQAAFSLEDDEVHSITFGCPVVVVLCTLNVEFENPLR